MVHTNTTTGQLGGADARSSVVAIFFDAIAFQALTPPPHPTRPPSPLEYSGQTPLKTDRKTQSGVCRVKVGLAEVSCLYVIIILRSSAWL